MKKSKDIKFVDLSKTIANRDYGSEMEAEHEHRLNKLLQYQEDNDY